MNGAGKVKECFVDFFLERPGGEGGQVAGLPIGCRSGSTTDS